MHMMSASTENNNNNNRFNNNIDQPVLLGSTVKNVDSPDTLTNGN